MSRIPINPDFRKNSLFQTNYEGSVKADTDRNGLLPQEGFSSAGMTVADTWTYQLDGVPYYPALGSICDDPSCSVFPRHRPVEPR